MPHLELFRHADNIRAFKAGDAIFALGDSGEEMFIILEGTVAVFVGGRVVMTLGPGEIVGEMALVDDDHTRTATVKAESDVKVAPVDRRQFEFLVRNHPTFATEVMKTIADRLRKMNEYLAHH
jgi:CRP/FNR family cyclic AMP-dependent transcriptional regulator